MVINVAYEQAADRGTRQIFLLSAQGRTHAFYQRP